MHTLFGLQETVSRRGPWAVRIHKPMTRMIVRLIVKLWGSLTKGSDSEKKWAKRRIIKDVSHSYPVAVWVIQILKWMLNRRHLGLDQTIAEIKNQEPL